MKNQENPRESLRILNSREKKEINQRVFEQWGCEFDKSLVFMLSNKEKLYLADTDIEKIDFKKIRIDHIGTYVATVDEKDVRLSIEGAQILGPSAKKNIIELSVEEMREWFRGLDILMEGLEQKGFMILKCGDDFIGSGKVTAKGMMNFVPKARRILSAD
jgi:NOL1/NOP2/fmu family ribosome biogenesis protein